MKEQIAEYLVIFIGVIFVVLSIIGAMKCVGCAMKFQDHWISLPTDHKR
jgi:hypothetical protein